MSIIKDVIKKAADRGFNASADAATVTISNDVLSIEFSRKTSIMTSKLRLSTVDGLSLGNAERYYRGGSIADKARISFEILEKADREYAVALLKARAAERLQQAADAEASAIRARKLAERAAADLAAYSGETVDHLALASEAK